MLRQQCKNYVKIFNFVFSEMRQKQTGPASLKTTQRNKNICKKHKKKKKRVSDSQLTVEPRTPAGFVEALSSSSVSVSLLSFVVTKLCKYPANLSAVPLSARVQILFAPFNPLQKNKTNVNSSAIKTTLI